MGSVKESRDPRNQMKLVSTLGLCGGIWGEREMASYMPLSTRMGTPLQMDEAQSTFQENLNSGFTFLQSACFSTVA